MRERRPHTHAFDLYCRQGSARSLTKLQAALAAEGTAPHLRTLEEWSRQFGWQARIEEFEAKVAADEEADRIREEHEMHDRHAHLGVLLQQRGATYLAQAEAGEFTPAAAIRAVKEGVQLELSARGAVRTQAQPGKPKPVSFTFDIAKATGHATNPERMREMAESTGAQQALSQAET